MWVHFGADGARRRKEAASLARASKRVVTSFRWSVLPQDAERLCVQEMARSPSSSCQDRGVCRERNPVRQLSSSNEPWGSHTPFSGRRWWLWVVFSHLLSSQPPECCQPLLLFQASPPALPLPTSSRKLSLISQQGQPALFSLKTFAHGLEPQKVQVLLPSSEDQFCPSLS